MTKQTLTWLKDETGKQQGEQLVVVESGQVPGPMMDIFQNQLQKSAKHVPEAVLILYTYIFRQVWGDETVSRNQRLEQTQESDRTVAQTISAERIGLGVEKAGLRVQAQANSSDQCQNKSRKQDLVPR